MTDVKDLSFEAALAELENIIDQLEKGNVELEQSITLYERGAALRKHCEGRLASAREKIEKVIVADQGEPTTAPASFD